MQYRLLAYYSLSVSVLALLIDPVDGQSSGFAPTALLRRLIDDDDSSQRPHSPYTECEKKLALTDCKPSSTTCVACTNVAVLSKWWSLQDDPVPCSESAQLAFCGFSAVAEKQGGAISNSCRTEILHTCDIHRAKAEGKKACITCAESHIKKIDSQLIEGSKCTQSKLMAFCGLTEVAEGKNEVDYNPIQGVGTKVLVAKGDSGSAEMSDSCHDEIRKSTCDARREKDRSMSACVSCVDSHMHKINRHLVKGSTCTPLVTLLLHMYAISDI
jgi:hypothetical protein